MSYLLIFACIAYAFYAILKKSLPGPLRLSSVSSSRNVIVSVSYSSQGSVPRQCACVCGVNVRGAKEGLRLVPSHEALQWFHYHHLLKRPPFPHSVALLSFLKIHGRGTCGSISVLRLLLRRPIGLYARTTPSRLQGCHGQSRNQVMLLVPQLSAFQSCLAYSRFFFLNFDMYLKISFSVSSGKPLGILQGLC